MAVEVFDQIYARLSADERKLIDNVFAKEPELKQGWMRRDDYSRNMNDLTSKKKRQDELEAYEAQMKPWAEDAHKRIKRLEDAGIVDAEGNETWTTQKAELERKLAAASVGGEDVDPVELQKRVEAIVKDAGGVTRTELDALIKDQAAKLAKETFETQWKEKETDFNTKTIPTVAGFASGVAVLASRYEKETGEAWTEEKAKELFELMGKEQVFNPYVIGDKMLSPHREKKQLDAEVEKRVQERLKAMKLPGGGDGDYIPQNFNEQKGALQAALERSGEGKEVDIQAQIREQSIKAAEALRSEGKF